MMNFFKKSRSLVRCTPMLLQKTAPPPTLRQADVSPIAIGAVVTVGAVAGYVLFARGDEYPPKGLSSHVKGLPEWIRLGCGDDEYFCAEKGATFPADTCPEKMPDLHKHNNYMAEVLRERPHLWNLLRRRQTKNGITLAKCIKTGVDNPGHPQIKTVGMVAGDEESYYTFKELFDPVIDRRHGGYSAHSKHPTCLDWNRVSSTPIDPTSRYVLSTRVRTGRSVRGMRLPPSCTFEERRELERVITKGLMNLSGELKGDYFPLAGSRSFGTKVGGMSKNQEDEMRENHFLFQEPDSTLLLSSGMGRHWPDARGIFHNDEKNFLVWVNEEDHMRIISMEKGADIKRIFKRFCIAVNGVQEVLKKEGYDFMHNDHHGYILTCPSNLGTGLRASAMMKIPLVSSRPDFKAVCKKMGLQPRGSSGVDSDSKGGIWDISNIDRIGKSEVALVNIMIEGCAKICRWEAMLEKGEDISHELPK